jgi:hypothetical protein
MPRWVAVVHGASTLVMAIGTIAIEAKTDSSTNIDIPVLSGTFNINCPSDTIAITSNAYKENTRPLISLVHFLFIQLSVQIYIPTMHTPSIIRKKVQNYGSMKNGCNNSDADNLEPKAEEALI